MLLVVISDNISERYAYNIQLTYEQSADLSNVIFLSESKTKTLYTLNIFFVSSDTYHIYE